MLQKAFRNDLPHSLKDLTGHDVSGVGGRVGRADVGAGGLDGWMWGRVGWTCDAAPTPKNYAT